MGHGVRYIAVMCLAADESDAPRQLIAFAASKYGFAGFSGTEVIDPQIQRRGWRKLAAFEPDADACRHVHERNDRPGGDNACRRITNKVFAIRQLEFAPVGPVRMIAQTHHAIMSGAAHACNKTDRVEISHRASKHGFTFA